MPGESTRPSASVIVPFAGTDAQLERVLAALRRLELAPSDELIVADNRPGAREHHRERAAIVAAAGLPTPGHARNTGAARASRPWLVFLDSDTRPSSSLLDDLFTPAPGPRTAVLAGAVHDVAGEPTLAARYGVARAHMSQEHTLGRSRGAYAQTANCAILRSAFERSGGFAEDARAGEDADLCFRLFAAGWELEQRPRAIVEHDARTTVGALLGQLRVHGSGAAWVNRRHPGTLPAPSAAQRMRRLGHHIREAGAAVGRGDGEAARFAMLDLAGAVAFDLGRRLPNRPGRFGGARRG